MQTFKNDLQIDEILFLLQLEQHAERLRFAIKVDLFESLEILQEAIIDFLNLLTRETFQVLQLSALQTLVELIELDALDKSMNELQFEARRIEP